MSDLHNVDAVRRTGGNSDELTTDSVTRPAELVALDGCHNVTLNTAHSHTQGKKLQRECFAGATGTDEVQVGVFIFLGVEQVHNAQRVIMTVDAEQHAGIIR